MKHKEKVAVSNPSPDNPADTSDAFGEGGLEAAIQAEEEREEAVAFDNDDD